MKIVYLEAQQTNLDGVKLGNLDSGQIDGVIFREYLNPKFVSQTARFANSIEKIESHFDRLPEGVIFPMSFPNILTEPISYIESCLQKSNYNIARFEHAVGFGLSNDIINFFRKINSGLGVSRLTLDQITPSFPLYTIRTLKPPLGRIPAHTEKYFINKFSESFDKTNLDLQRNIFSYFIMIQKAQEGGNLSLYELRWNKQQSKKDFNEDIITIDRIQVDMNNNTPVQPKLCPGDIIVFNAGDIWHRIEPIIGEKERITIGGFVGYEKGSGNLIVWG